MPDNSGHAGERGASENVGSVVPSRHDKCMRGRDPVIRENGAIEIPLTQGQVALVDAGDYHGVRDRRWHAAWCRSRKTWVARAGHCGPLMHRRIMSPDASKQVDHRSRNTLDNRRENLRVATQPQNMHNQGSRGGSSRFKGVSSTPGDRWVANIRCNGEQYSLGHFDSEEGAARAYDAAALEMHGDFAETNVTLGLLVHVCLPPPERRRKPQGPYPGVSWYRASGKWRARVRSNGRDISLGYFSALEDAIAARKAAVTALREGREIPRRR